MNSGTRASAQVATAFVFAITITIFALPALAQTFSYAAINVPGAVATEARGINNNGEIVGFYKTVACQDYDIKVPSCAVKGFKFVNGSFVKLMVPNSTSTAILGVNDLGDLVGFYRKSDGTRHGFIWYHTNVVKTIDFPGTASTQGVVTAAFGINRVGTVVGGVWSISSTGTFPSNGFVWVNGTFTTMDPTPSNPASPCCWSVNGIANTGVIVGQLFDADFNQAWYKAGKDQDFFMEFPNNGDTFATGVNSRNDMIGNQATFGGGWFAKNIEANEGTTDATETTPSFIKVAFPGSMSTVPFGVNYARAVVGVYTDSAGHQHGFMAKPNF
jgi:uncharacterized membrane protein